MQVAKDSSGKGNDLVIASPPQRGDAVITKGTDSLHTGARRRPRLPPAPRCGRACPPSAPAAELSSAPRAPARSKSVTGPRRRPLPLPLAPRCPCPLCPGRLEFRNNAAVGAAAKGMPTGSFSVEFWAKGQALVTNGDAQVGGAGRSHPGLAASPSAPPGCAA